MCVNSISVACDDVKRLFIIDCSRKVQPDFTHNEASCTPERRKGLLYVMIGAREAMIVTSHYDRCTPQLKFVTGLHMSSAAAGSASAPASIQETAS